MFLHSALRVESNQTTESISRYPIRFQWNPFGETLSNDGEAKASVKRMVSDGGMPTKSWTANDEGDGHYDIKATARTNKECVSCNTFTK